LRLDCIPVVQVDLSNVEVWPLGVDTIIERILVVPVPVSDLSYKLWCPLGVGGKNRHVVASGERAKRSLAEDWFEFGNLRNGR